MTVQTEQFLKTWHKAIEQKDIRLIEPLFSDQIVLSSPALFKPKKGKKLVVELLTDVLATFEGYKVTKTWIDGNEILLEFDTKVGDRSLQGIDRITLDSEGKMEHLKVYIRPFQGLQALISAIVQLNLARAEKEMTLSQKLLVRSRYWMKSKLQTLLK